MPDSLLNWALNAIVKESSTCVSIIIDCHWWSVYELDNTEILRAQSQLIQTILYETERWQDCLEEAESIV